MTNWILNSLLAAIGIYMVVAALRSRQVQYRDITAAEISPDVSAGEDLLQDALAAELAMDHPAHEPARVANSQGRS